MNTYLVVAIYADNLQPFAEDFAADTPEDAQTMAQDMASEAGTYLYVAGVYEVHASDKEALDQNEYARMKNVA